MTTHVFFEEIMQKQAIRENYASEEKKCTLIVVILQVKILIAIVYRPQEKKNANNIKRAMDFYYYSPFLYGNISVCQIWCVCNMLMHIYLSSVFINRMLISQLKRFLGVKFKFPPRFNV